MGHHHNRHHHDSDPTELEEMPDSEYSKVNLHFTVVPPTFLVFHPVVSEHWKNGKIYLFFANQPHLRSCAASNSPSIAIKVVEEAVILVEVFPVVDVFNKLLKVNVFNKLLFVSVKILKVTTKTSVSSLEMRYLCAKLFCNHQHQDQNQNHPVDSNDHGIDGKIGNTCACP